MTVSFKAYDETTCETDWLMECLLPEPVEQYLKTFHWNKVKYRADKPLGEIIDVLQKVLGYPSASWLLRSYSDAATVRKSLVSIMMLRTSTISTIRSRQHSWRYNENRGMLSIISCLTLATSALQTS